MNDSLRNILRETGISLADDWLKAVDRAVTTIGTSRPAVSQLLDYVRLSFSHAEGDTAAFREAINSANEDSPFELVPSTRSEHLIRVLAGATLVARFTSDEMLTARTSPPAVTCAALAVRMLKRCGDGAIHPDVPHAADQWLADMSARDRDAGALSTPTGKRASATTSTDPNETAEPSPVDDLKTELDQLQHRIDVLETSSGSKAVLRTAEQADIIAWLLSERELGAPGESGVQIARELALMTRFPSPISSAGQLLARRLGEKATKRASAATIRGLTGHLDRLAPTDLAPLADGHGVGPLSAVELALALYDELMFQSAYKSATLK